MPAKKPKLTEKQLAAGNAIIDGHSWTESARMAGYADPSGEVDRLKKNVDFVEYVVQGLKKKNLEYEVTWNRLRKKMMDALDRNLEPGEVEFVENRKGEMVPVVLGPKAADNNTAAKIVADTLLRMHGAKGLQEAAKQEDTVEERAKAADDILGPAPVTDPTSDETPAEVPSVETVQ